MFLKIVSVLYYMLFAIFIGVIVLLDIMPNRTLFLFSFVFLLFNIILTIQIHNKKILKPAKILAITTSICMMFIFVTTSIYGLNTLSFLNNASTVNAKTFEKESSFEDEKPFNVCMTGIDTSGTIDKKGRSDVNMIATINPKTRQILLTSIPRDYEIQLSEQNNSIDKLTHTGIMGIDTTIKAEEDLLDIKIDHYIKINFSTIKKLIDAIGGIDVYSEYEFTPIKKKDFQVKKGINHMNGKEALAFARERKAFSDGDIQRIKNQQAVFEALIDKIIHDKKTVLKYNKILSNLQDYFELSFSSSEITNMLKYQLSKSPNWEVYKNSLIGGNASMTTYSTGNTKVYVMSQNKESIENATKLINGVLSGDKILKDEEDKLYLESEILEE